MTALRPQAVPIAFVGEEEEEEADVGGAPALECDEEEELPWGTVDAEEEEPLGEEEGPVGEVEDPEEEEEEEEETEGAVGEDTLVDDDDEDEDGDNEEDFEEVENELQDLEIELQLEFCLVGNARDYAYTQPLLAEATGKITHALSQMVSNGDVDERGLIGEFERCALSLEQLYVQDSHIPAERRLPVLQRYLGQGSDRAQVTGSLKLASSAGSDQLTLTVSAEHSRELQLCLATGGTCTLVVGITPRPGRAEPTVSRHDP